MKRMILFLFIAGLTACQHHQQTSAFNQGDYTLPFNQWGFVFFTPRLLPALVTDAIVVDTTGRMYRFHTLDMSQDDGNTVGSWNKLMNSTYFFNTIKHPAPPQYIAFCWDSWVDKKHYETSMFFLEPVWRRMMAPATHKTFSGETYWYDTLLFGLAPGGTVKVWFQEEGAYYNIPVQPTNLKTLSGDELNICKGVSKNIFSKNLDADIAEFIKGKTYPYGEW
ncbi:TPA: DUF2931 family protein [Salmonella enterica]|nr:hypothetical protein [Salmonella enterica subsp. enterica serovar Claibornei]HED5889160.1 DUF2931 family protein [Salmonella enterica]